MSRFLITGLPRTRSAWFSALFSSAEVSCYHDRWFHGGSDRMLAAIVADKSPVVGLCDPGAACAYPREALLVFRESPIVVVRRNEHESRQSFTRWAAREPNDWGALMRNFTWFMDHVWAGMQWVNFDDLEDFDVVAQVYAHCTGGRSLDKHRFDLFNTLKIEQHLGKAAAFSGAL